VLKLWQKFKRVLVYIASKMEGDMKKCPFRPTSRFISKTAQDMAIVTKEDE